jgi:hypothetical protein
MKFAHIHATCQTMTDPHNFQCACPIITPTVPTMSRRATCHPCSGFTCHNLTRPHLHLPTSAPIHISMPTHPATSPVWSYNLYSQLPHQHCMDCTVNIFFACLTKRTDCDIFRIRCLFELIQVALGSYR